MMCSTIQMNSNGSLVNYDILTIDFETNYLKIKGEYDNLDKKLLNPVISSVHGEWNTINLYKEGIVSHTVIHH
jgi:hypothetical protein